MRNVSATALRSMLAQETGEVFLICLTISHPSLAETYYLVNDFNPLNRGVDFTTEFLTSVHKAGTTLTVTTDALPSTALVPCLFAGLSLYPTLNGQTPTPTSIVTVGLFSTLTFTVPAGWPDFGPSGDTGSMTLSVERTFVPFAFDVNLPNEQDDQLPQVTMTIDNIDNAILQAIRSIPGQRPAVKLEVVLASSPETVEAGPFDFSILSINYSDASIQGTIGFEDDLLNTAFPADTYTPTNSKGLFP